MKHFLGIAVTESYVKNTSERVAQRIQSELPSFAEYIDWEFKSEVEETLDNILVEEGVKSLLEVLIHYEGSRVEVALKFRDGVIVI